MHVICTHIMLIGMSSGGNQQKLWTEPMWQILEGLTFEFCSVIDILKELAHPCQFQGSKRERNGYKYAQSKCA